jgi:hypothetical protein
MSFPLNSTLVATVNVRKHGDLVDPTTATLTLYKPDRTLATVSGAQVSTGVYNATFVANQAGYWHYRWTTAGAGADGTKESWFEVSASNLPP